MLMSNRKRRGTIVCFLILVWLIGTNSLERIDNIEGVASDTSSSADVARSMDEESLSEDEKAKSEAE